MNVSIKDNEGDINKHHIDGAIVHAALSLSLCLSRPTTGRGGGGGSLIEHNLETKTG